MELVEQYVDTQAHHGAGGSQAMAELPIRLVAGQGLQTTHPGRSDTYRDTYRPKPSTLMS